MTVYGREIDLKHLSSKSRCIKWRKHILEVSQKVSALHIAPAFSCIEIVDSLYFSIMKLWDEEKQDVFIMSKGHGCMSQYVILEAIGVLNSLDIQNYCKPVGKLGAHPDLSIPGIHASTGSLGHGLGIALGQANAERIKESDVIVYCLLSDGELQEGSTWEAIMMAANLNSKNLVAIVDYNDFGGLEKMTKGFPAFAPLKAKFEAFGWETVDVNGHDSREIVHAILNRSKKGPFALIAHTTKGKGVSFMEDVPIWHYRSPNSQEYELAIAELNRGIDA